MTYCPWITQTLRIISVRCIPLRLRSKTQRRATLLIPTWIYSCQSVETVNFALPFTTNVKISISILQTFRSWVATSHLRQPMAFLYHNSSDTPGLAPLMNVLFWEAVRLSNKLLGKGYVKERLKSSLRKFYGRYGDLMKQYDVPLSRMLHDILEDDHIEWHPPLMRHYTKFWPFVVSHFGTFMRSNVETNISWTCLVSGLLSFEHSSVLLFCSLLSQCVRKIGFAY